MYKQIPIISFYCIRSTRVIRNSILLKTQYINTFFNISLLLTAEHLYHSQYYLDRNFCSEAPLFYFPLMHLLIYMKQDISKLTARKKEPGPHSVTVVQFLLTVVKGVLDQVCWMGICCFTDLVVSASMPHIRY